MENNYSELKSLMNNNENENYVYELVTDILNDDNFDIDILKTILDKKFIYYPHIIILWIQTFGFDNYDIVNWIERIIERRLELSLYILTNFLNESNWTYKKEDNPLKGEDSALLLRPYLMINIDQKWLDILSELKPLNLWDREFDWILSLGYTFNPELKIKHYGHDNIFEYQEYGIYYGYRHSWHLLTYANKEYRYDLLEHWEDTPDCTFDGFVDYYKFVMKKELPKIFIENVKNNLSSLEEIEFYLFECF